MKTLLLGSEPQRLDNLVLTPNLNAARSYGAAPLSLEAARTVLDTGSFSPDPAERMCRYCEYGLLCRRGPRLSRKVGKVGG